MNGHIGTTDDQANAFIKSVKASSVTKEQMVAALTAPELIEALKEADRKLQVWFEVNKHTIPYPRRRFLELEIPKRPLTTWEKLEKTILSKLI